MGGGWPRTCPFLRLGKLVVALRAGPSTGCGVQGVEKAQNLHGGGFPVEWLGLLIAPL